MKNLEQREGFKNRHIDLLPEQIRKINIVTKDINGEHIYLCEWRPFDKKSVSAVKKCQQKGIWGPLKLLEVDMQVLAFTLGNKMILSLSGLS